MRLKRLSTEGLHLQAGVRFFPNPSGSEVLKAERRLATFGRYKDEMNLSLFLGIQPGCRWPGERRRGYPD